MVRRGNRPNIHIRCVSVPTSLNAAQVKFTLSSLSLVAYIKIWIENRYLMTTPVSILKRGKTGHHHHHSPHHGGTPVQLKMGCKNSSDMLSHCPDLLLKQTKLGWVRELWGCEAETEFNLRSSNGGHSFYAIEQSSEIMRFFLSRLHPWSMTLYHGTSDIEPSVKMMTYQRPLRLPSCPLKCCCHQTVTHHDADGEFVGDTVENFYGCVPKFSVRDESGAAQYVISQPTCLDGLCVDFFAEGVFNLRQPFYVYKIGSEHTNGREVAKIVKVWSGLSNELFTDADHFVLNYDQVHAPAARARLLGSLFLLNQLFFEGKSSLLCL